MSFFDEVYKFTKQIPKGKVATYGQIAALCGNKRMSRQVGWALHSNPCQSEIPCHRIIDRNGNLCKGFAFGGIDAQRLLLQSEGVEVGDDYTVDLDKFRWDFK